MQRYVRLFVDWGPIVLFFTAYKVAGIYAATATLIAAAIAAVIIGYISERRLAPVPLFTAVVVGTLGGLTLYFKDDTFIKMKPTIVYIFLGGALIGSECIGRPVAKPLLGAAVRLQENAWRILAYRFGAFFFIMACLNEIVWRSFSRDVWVNYHTFGAMALTFIFAASQTPFMMRHAQGDETPQETDVP